MNYFCCCKASIETENSLKKWIDKYPNRFKNGEIIIGSFCIETIVCHHVVILNYINLLGTMETKTFSTYDGDGKTILYMLKKYPNTIVKWNNNSLNDPLIHFKCYEKL